MKLWIRESYKYNNLNDDEQSQLYDSFYDTYMSTTGGAFDHDDFDWRARGWTFFGTKPNTPNRQIGGIAVRVQNSGMVKLVASFGNPRGVMDGLKELESEFGDRPIWGFMPDNICNMLLRADKNFVRLPTPIVKVMMKSLGNSAPGLVSINDDGSATFNTPSGPMDKFYVCNKVYCKWLLESATDPKYADRIPVPQIVLKPLIKLIEKIIGE